MKPDDASEFASWIAALYEGFGRKTSEAAIHGYWLGLNDLEMGELQRAVAVALREKQHLPTPAELRELAGVRSVEGRAIVAWEEFAEAVVRVGGYASVDFEDRLINATVRNLGGWERVCELPCEEFDKWLRKDFERVYRELARSGGSSESMQPLVGICERVNLFHGRAVAAPRLIACGDRSRSVPALPSQPKMTDGGFPAPDLSLERAK